jgi:hypothetical protein
MFVNFSDAASHNVNTILGGSETMGDTTDPNRFYWIATTNGGNIPYKEVLGYVEYSGSDTAASLGSNWTTSTSGSCPNGWRTANGGNICPLTPDPSNSLYDIMNACVTAGTVCQSDPNFSAANFKSCEVSDVHGDYIKIACLSYIQDSPTWLFIYRISTNALVAGGNTYSNPVLRWAGEHGISPDDSTAWLADSCHT